MFLGKWGSMSKEKQIQKYESKQLLDELSKMSPMVIATAYLYAVNYTLYGEDVTEKWLTAIQNTSALEKAYREGYHDAMERVNQVSKGSNPCPQQLGGSDVHNKKGGYRYE